MIAQLNNVAGGHARAYYEFAPCSVFARLTPKLVAGYKTYGFDEEGNFTELSRIGQRDGDNCDLPDDEFWLGGEIVRNLDDDTKANLEAYGVHLYANPEKLFDELAEAFLGGNTIFI